MSNPVIEASGEAYNNTFHKVRADISRDQWDKVWVKAVEWARANPTGELTLLVAENGKTERVTFMPADRPDLYEKWKMLSEAHLRGKNLGLV